MNHETNNENWLLRNNLLKSVGNPGPLLPKSIIGPEDQREPCPDVKENPFRWICQIESKRQLHDGRVATAYGSGCLIGRRTILTAAHNFFVEGRRVSKQDVQITLGTDGDRSRPVLGAYAVAEIEIEPNYDPSVQVSQYDIAVIGLRSPYPADQIQNLGSQLWAEVGSSRLLHEHAFVSGYPTNQPRTPPPTNPANAVQYWHLEQVTDIAPGELFYAIDTTVGQSGSPILVQLPLENGGTDTVAVGVHTNAASDRLPNRGLTIEGSIADFVRYHYDRLEPRKQT